jgi:hypothetical protein
MEIELGSRIGVRVIFEIVMKIHSDPLSSLSQMDLLDHLIRLHQRPLRNRQANLLGRLQIDH